jgi:hypothetical protein
MYFEKTPVPGPYSTINLFWLKSILLQTFFTPTDEVGVIDATFLSLMKFIM